MGGDSKASRRSLSQALKQNPYVPDYLLGRKPLPKKLPDYVGFGDEREALWCVAELGDPWLGTSGALRWLQDVAGPAGPIRRR